MFHLSGGDFVRNKGSNISARRESKAVFFVTSLKAMIMACWVTKSINRVNPAWSAVGDSPYCPLKRFLRVGMDSPTEGWSNETVSAISE